MSNFNIKNLVNIIQKNAGKNNKPIPGSLGDKIEVPVKSKTRQVPSTDSKAVPSGTKTTPGVKSSSSSIKEMQQSIQIFASTAINYHLKRDPGTGKQTPISIQSPNEKNQPSQNFSNFNDFVTLNYLNSSPIRGNEWSTNEAANTPDQKNPVYDDQLVQMQNVVDNIARIGSRGSERFVDGIWGYKTQNALKNLYAFGDAIIRVSEDFDAPDSVKNLFTKQDTEKMRKLIPEQLKTLSDTEKTSNASGLTGLIDKLTRFYLYFANNVTKHPAYRRFTDSTTPLWVQQASTTQKDPGDISEYQDLMRNIDTLNLPRITVLTSSGAPKVVSQFPLTALTKPYVLEDIMVQHGGYLKNEITKDMQMRFLKQVMQQINELLASNNFGGSAPLVTGPNNPFGSGGALAPVPPNQKTPSTSQPEWSWAQKPQSAWEKATKPR